MTLVSPIAAMSSRRRRSFPGYRLRDPAPMLILFGAACLGIIVEAAFRAPAAVPGPARAGDGRPVRRARGGHHRTRDTSGPSPPAARSRSTVPALFLQGSILVLGIVALLLISDRTLERGGPFVAQAAVTANTDADRPRRPHRAGATEVYPLAMFSPRRHDAVHGGQRPADDVRGAGGLLASAVPAVRAGPPPPPARAGGGASSTSCSARSRRRSSCSGSRWSTATPAGSTSPASTRSPRLVDRRRPAVRGPRDARDRSAVQGGRGAVPRVDAGRVPGRADADHRADGRLHQGRRVRWSAPCAVRRVPGLRSGTSSR